MKEYVYCIRYLILHTVRQLINPNLSICLCISFNSNTNLPTSLVIIPLPIPETSLLVPDYCITVPLQTWVPHLVTYLQTYSLIYFSPYLPKDPSLTLHFFSHSLVVICGSYIISVSGVYPLNQNRVHREREFLSCHRHSRTTALYGLGSITLIIVSKHVMKYKIFVRV